MYNGLLCHYAGASYKTTIKLNKFKGHFLFAEQVACCRIHFKVLIGERGVVVVENPKLYLAFINSNRFYTSPKRGVLTVRNK